MKQLRSKFIDTSSESDQGIIEAIIASKTNTKDIEALSEENYRFYKEELLKSDGLKLLENIVSDNSDQKENIIQLFMNYAKSLVHAQK